MGKSFDFKLVFTQIPKLLTKLPITLELSILAMVLGLLLGLLMAVIKVKQIKVLTRNIYMTCTAVIDYLGCCAQK